MAGFLTAAAAAVGSSSIGGALVRILIAYGISRLINKSTGQDNGTPIVDQGVRLQASPDTTNPIPLLYGSAYLGGKITDAQLVDANTTMWYCLTLAEVPTTVTTRLSDGAVITTNVDEIYWNNQRVYFQADGVTIDYLVNQDGIVDTSPRDLVKIYLYANGSATPILPSDLGEYISPLPSVPTDARNLFPIWDNTFRMSGLTFALVKVSYNKDKGITSLPELQFTVSNNLFKPGDAIYSFLRNTISGAGLSDAEIDTASLIALNDYADDEVNYIDETDGLTYQLGDRYQINGVINPSNTVLDNLTNLANNTGAFVNYDIARGLWGIKINRDAATSLAFDDSNIISGIDLTGTALDNMYNSVIVEFPHRELRDQTSSIRIDLPDEFRNANEPDNVLNLKLDMLNEPLQARELGYLELYQNRMDRVVTFTTDYSKINTEAGDVISITNSVYNWNNQLFRVVRVREVESENGGIAVEITAQEYDPTMYTAGGVPRRPRVPTPPIDIPDIAVIGTPAAPTLAEINSVAVPAIDITGVTPSGIVDNFEYWYSTDGGTTYKILGNRSNSNGSPYNQGTSLTFRAASLPAGTYLFKVRAGNDIAFGDYSEPATPFVWEPVQVTDQVTDTTLVQPTGSLIDLLPALGMGALAYFAYKALEPELLAALSQTELGKLLGIVDPAEIAAAQAALEQQSAAFRIVNAGGASLSAGVDDTLTFTAGTGIEFEVNDIGHEIIIKATGTGGTGGTTLAFSKVKVPGQDDIVADQTSDTLTIKAGSGITITTDPTTDTLTITNAAPGTEGAADPVYTTVGLPGSVFPTVYGTGDNAGITKSRMAIFTHDWMVFGGIEAAAHLKSTNICDVGDELVPNVPGVIASDYSFASLYDWTYNSGTTNFDRGAFNTSIWANTTGTWTSPDRAAPATYVGPYISLAGIGVRVYYTTCDYNAGVPLSQQAWGPWKLYYYTTSTVHEPAGSTNPDLRAKPEYRVDRQFEYEGMITDSDGPGWTDYDSFVPDLPLTKLVVQNNLFPEQPLTVEAGKLIAFGASTFKFGGITGADTSFAERTIWGYVDGGLNFRKQLSFRDLAINGSTQVAIGDQRGEVYYSTNNGSTWTLVEAVSFNGAAATNIVPTTFTLVAYGDGKFFVWKPGVGSSVGGGVANSTDGSSWTEYISNMDSSITSVAWSGTKWTAIGPTTIQTSTDGITWTTV